MGGRGVLGRMSPSCRRLFGRHSGWRCGVLIGLAMVVASCGGAGAESESAVAAVPTAPLAAAPTPTLDPVEARNRATANLDGVPDPQADADLAERNLRAGVNIAIADVALEDIVFDTFDGGSVTLADATATQIEGLLNAIPPLDDPVYTSIADAAWLTDDDLVLGYVGSDGSAWAHPHRVLNFHEIVNTTVAGEPVAITYCPLCGSGLVFDRRPNDLRHDGLLTFDNSSALYQNDMVMVDAETHTYWWQVSGTGIVGNLTGTQLTLLPSMTTTWAAWRELHPDTQVLGNDQGRGPSYELDPFASYGTQLDAGRASFPTDPAAFADKRLSPSTRIIGFDVDGAPGAVAVLANTPTVVPIDDTDLVVLLDGQGGGGLYSTRVRGEPTSFIATAAGFVDTRTGSEWNAAGRSIAGPAVNTQLTPAPSSSAYWFAWVSTLDGEPSLLFGPGES